jgi:hypothetical protein
MSEASRNDLVAIFNREHGIDGDWPVVPPGYQIEILEPRRSERDRYVQIGEWRVHEYGGQVRKERDLEPGVRVSHEALFRGMGIEWLKSATGYQEPGKGSRQSRG